MSFFVYLCICVSVCAVCAWLLWQGANLSRARQISGIMSVEIEANQVHIVAANTEASEAARDVLEFSKESVFIQPAEARLLIGKGGKNIRDLQAKCQLFSINVHDDLVMLVGLSLRLSLSPSVSLSLSFWLLLCI